MPGDSGRLDLYVARWYLDPRAVCGWWSLSSAAHGRSAAAVSVSWLMGILSFPPGFT